VVKNLLLDVGAVTLVFISYIDDVSKIIRYCRLHIYADDLQMYHTCAVWTFKGVLNLDLQRVHI
jgi:hypothetical protein